MAKVIDYLGGAGVPTEADAKRATDARAQGIAYSFRGRFFGEVEPVDAWRGEDQDMQAAYKAAGIPQYTEGTVPDKHERPAYSQPQPNDVSGQSAEPDADGKKPNVGEEPPQSDEDVIMEKPEGVDAPPGTEIEANSFEAPEKPKAKTDAKAADADAPVVGQASDDELKSYLSGKSADEMNAYWDSQDESAMADYLVATGRERKDGWKTQTMGNMIERHLGLDA